MSSLSCLLPPGEVSAPWNRPQSIRMEFCSSRKSWWQEPVTPSTAPWCFMAPKWRIEDAPVGAAVELLGPPGLEVGASLIVIGLFRHQACSVALAFSWARKALRPGPISAWCRPYSN